MLYDATSMKRVQDKQGLERLGLDYRRFGHCVAAKLIFTGRAAMLNLVMQDCPLPGISTPRDSNHVACKPLTCNISVRELFQTALCERLHAGTAAECPLSMRRMDGHRAGCNSRTVHASVQHACRIDGNCARLRGPGFVVLVAKKRRTTTNRTQRPNHKPKRCQVRNAKPHLWRKSKTQHNQPENKSNDDK